MGRRDPRLGSAREPDFASRDGVRNVKRKKHLSTSISIKLHFPFALPSHKQLSWNKSPPPTTTTKEERETEIHAARAVCGVEASEKRFLTFI